jgi:phosphoribosyl 1,2-cyclic phosphate phosphodiesterase
VSARGFHVPEEAKVKGLFSILFLGTGAADWSGEYDASLEEAERGTVRGMSSILINGKVLIDCGPTVFDAMRLFGADPLQITDLLITHTHGDHLNREALEQLITARVGAEPLRVWVEEGGLEKVPALEGMVVEPLKVGQQFEVGGISVLALAANHVVRPPEQPLHFLFQRGGCIVLYATDGAWFLKETWLRLRETKLDAILWDATNGDSQGDWRIFEHNSVDMIRVMLQTLEKEELMAPDAQVLLTHMARTLCAPHEEMRASLEPEGLIPAHDGLVVELGVVAE